MKYRPEIDGLRAIAVLPVLFFHAGFETFKGGFVGVDVFFVISGYLITSIILKEMESGHFSIWKFYDRRIRRILPALFLVMLVTIPLAWWLLIPRDMKDFSESLVAVLMFSSNLLFWLESGYFDTLAELKPLLHSWSLSVEEQYYILFPPLLLWLFRYGRRRLFTVLFLLSIFSIAFAEWQVSRYPSAAFYLLPARMWEILIGALCALALIENPKISDHSYRHIVSSLGLFFIAIAIFGFDHGTPTPSLWTLIPTLGTAAIILYASEGTFVNRLLRQPSFVGIGLISYSTYLWHQPLLAFARQTVYAESMLLLSGMLVASIFFAYLSWRFVEAPFRDRKSLSSKKVLLILTPVAICFLAFGVAGHMNQGFVKRDHMVAFENLRLESASEAFLPCGLDLSETLNYCNQTSPKVMGAIIGDSHAKDKLSGLKSAFGEEGWLLLGNSSCPPLSGVEFFSMTRNCSNKSESLLSYLEASPAISTVIISFGHFYPLSENYAQDHVRKNVDRTKIIIKDPSQPNLDKPAAFYLGIERTVDRLRRANKVVVILNDIPELPFFPEDCLRGHRACTLPIVSILERQSLHRRELKRLEEKYVDVHLFDTSSIFCGSAQCRFLRDGKSLYRDSHHLSRDGSLLFGEKFKEWFEKHVAPNQPK